MTEAPKPDDEKLNADSTVLGKITAKTTDNENLNRDGPTEIKTAYHEKNLIVAVQTLLRHHGVRKSGAAIRDAVDIPHK